MSNHQTDTRYLGGQEYAPAQHQAPQQPPQQWAPPAPPSMRPAPAGYGQPGPAAPAPAAVSAPAVAAATGQPAAIDNDEIVLSRAYSAHGEEVQRIKLRRPVGKDVKKAGYPLRPILGDNGEMKGYDILADVVIKYIHLLASPPLPPSTVDQFEIVDLNACSQVINGFFQA